MKFLTFIFLCINKNKALIYEKFQGTKFCLIKNVKFLPKLNILYKAEFSSLKLVRGQIL